LLGAGWGQGLLAHLALGCATCLLEILCHAMAAELIILGQPRPASGQPTPTLASLGPAPRAGALCKQAAQGTRIILNA